MLNEISLMISIIALLISIATLIIGIVAFLITIATLIIAIFLNQKANKLQIDISGFIIR